MQSLQSEQLFEDYLKRENILFQRNHPVNGCNVDFCLTKNKKIIYCDVKEVQDSQIKLKEGQEKMGGALNAQDHIKGDIKKLRSKFEKPPVHPILLVTMNFSSIFYTGLTISRALLGDLGILFDRDDPNNYSPVHHLHKGNAALTTLKNRSISGVLGFDVCGDGHYLFLSPYANNPIPSDYFNVQTIHLNKDENEEDIQQLSRITFYQHD